MTGLHDLERSVLERRLAGWSRGIVVSLFVAISVGAACGAQPKANLTIQAALRDGLVEISGQTNLPNGSKLTVLGWHHEESERQGLPAGLPGLPITVVAADGGYSATVATASWPVGTVTLLSTFEVHEGQPPEVAERFGRNGENLVGSQVREDSDGVRVLEVSVELGIPG